MSEKFRRIIVMLLREDVPFHMNKTCGYYHIIGEGKAYWEINDMPEGVYFNSGAELHRHFEEELSYIIMAIRKTW